LEQYAQSAYLPTALHLISISVHIWEVKTRIILKHSTYKKTCQDLKKSCEEDEALNIFKEVSEMEDETKEESSDPSSSTTQPQSVEPSGSTTQPQSVEPSGSTTQPQSVEPSDKTSKTQKS